jgi:Fur family zinc uptake transcriptional regulator
MTKSRIAKDRLVANPRQNASFPAPKHDHGACVADILSRGREAFERKGLRMTPLRSLIFEEIAASHTALGAYEILDRLARKSDTRLAPISVYRAIDALLEAGVVHRLESRNAFFACHTRHAPDRRTLVLACDGCDTVLELPGEPIFRAIDTSAQEARFVPSQIMVEVRGQCSHCAASGGNP